MPPICQQCGGFVPPQNKYTTCYNCYKHPPTLSLIRATAWLTAPVRPIIHQFKYSGRTRLAHPLANLLIERWSLWEMDVDMVVPIPLHPEREQERGFNQSHLIAEPFAERVGIPLETEAVFRVRATRQQAELSSVDRRKNVAGAFQANGKLVRGQRILLIDDVVTTGSTLNAAGEALYKAGAESVSAYCVARAYPKRRNNNV